MLTTIFVLLFVNIQIAYSREYLLRVKSNAPAIKGSLVTFTADLLELNGTLVNVGDTSLKWEWLIDDHDRHELKTSVPHAQWTYQFPKQSNESANKVYKLDVSVGQLYIFFTYPMATTSVNVNITTLLNGKLQISQDGSKIKSVNASTQVPLEHELEIRREDLDSIANATTTTVHWFVDCHYVRQTKELKTQHIFLEPNKTHHIEALIEASFEAVPPKVAPTLNSKLISDWRSQHRADLPYVCNNHSKIIPDPKKVYGYFESNITVFDPVSDLIVNGSTWISDGDDYQLNFYCTGSPNFEYCIHQIDGPYMWQGNETCNEWITLEECQQSLNLTQSVLNVKSFSVLVIIRNAISIERKIFVVNIKQPMVLVAAVAGSIVFTLCVIAAVVFCYLQYLRKKKSASNKPSVRSDAETTLISQKPGKEIKLKPNIH